jgi:hypothetical protein
MAVKEGSYADGTIYKRMQTPNKKQLTGRHIGLKYGDQFEVSNLVKLNRVLL